MIDFLIYCDKIYPSIYFILMMRSSTEIAAKIEELLFFQKKTKAGLGIALGAKEDDENAVKFSRYNSLKKSLEIGKIDTIKLAKVAEYLETTIEGLMIQEGNTQIASGEQSMNLSGVSAGDINNNKTINTSPSKNLSRDEKIDFIFEKLKNL